MEVEELPPQVVSRRRRSRVSLSAAIAAVVLVGLLAVGFGALGGRPEASSGPSQGAAVPSGSANGPASAPAATPSLPDRTPRVTPYLECGPQPERAPEIALSVDGAQTLGSVEVVPPGPATDDPPGPPIDIAADAVTEIRVALAACATAWRIALSVDDGAELEPLSIQANPEQDPSFALQNRFSLPLTEHRFASGELELLAALDFAGLHALATWPIRFVLFDRPQPRLLIVGENRSVPTVEGCDIGIRFRNGYTERIGECDYDLSGPLPPPIALEPGTPLQLTFDGWSVTETIAICGAASELAFVTLPAPGCWQESQGDREFVAPKPGDWALGMAACAVDSTRDLGNRICGTWYASVDTR